MSWYGGGMSGMNAREVVAVTFWSVGIAAIWLGPALFGYAMHITDHDAALYYYPIFDFYAKALQSGRSFLWMPGIFSGFPIYASQVAGFFDPLNIAIFSFFDGFSGVHMRLFLDYVATFIFSYLVGRSFQLSRTASALIGPSFVIAFHVRFLSNPIIANTLFLVPLLMYAANGILHATLKKWHAILCVGIGVGISLLSGYTQMVVYAVLATAAYVLVYVLLDRAESVRSFAHKGGIFVAGLFLGLVIGLPFVLPAGMFLSETARSSSPTYEEATKKVAEFGDVVLFAVPDHFYIPYVTSGRKPLYVGALWALLAFTAFVYACVIAFRRRREERNPSLIAIAAVFVIFLLLALQHSPLYYLFSQLPVVGHFRFPYRFMYVGIFFFVLLGAFGFDRLGEMLKTRAVWIGAWFFTITFGVVAVGIAAVNMLGEASSQALAEKLHASATAFNLYALLGLTKGGEHYAEALVRALTAMRELLSIHDAMILIPLLLLSSAVLIFGLRLKETIDDGWFRNTAIALSVITVVSIPILRYRYYVPIIEAGIAPHAAMPFVTTDDTERYRLYSFLPGASIAEFIPPQYKLSFEEEKVVKEVNVAGAFPNYHLYHPLGSVDGYDQFETLDSLAAIELIGGELYAGYGSGSYEERKKRLLESLDVLAMMGGKYIISGVPLDHPRLHLLSRETRTQYQIPLQTYELDARPRYYFAENVHSLPHSGFRDLMRHAPSFANGATYLDCNSCISVKGRLEAKLVQQENGLYVFETITTAGDYLILSESYLPGWRAWIDWKEVPLVRANGLYMAALVPEGTHRVRFEYEGLYRELSALKLLGLVE